MGGGDVYAEVTAKIWAETQLTNLTGFRLEALLHPNLPYGGPGILGKARFIWLNSPSKLTPRINPP